MSRSDLLGDVGSDRIVPVGFRHDAPTRCPVRRSVPSDFGLDETRRSVQNETYVYCGRKTDPLWPSRKFMTIGHGQLANYSNLKLVGLLEVGDPKGEVRNAWHAKEAVRSVCAIDDAYKAIEFVAQLGISPQD
jgi:hypothetical protein